MSFFKFNNDEQMLKVYNPLFDKIQLNLDPVNSDIKNPKIFCIDGNIGSGKSTILDELKNRGYTVFKENLEEWMSVLTLFYQKPKRWMFTLQVKIATSMKKQYDEISYHISDPYVFVERSPLSTLLFIKNGIRNGYLTFEEIETFTEIFNQNFWVPDNIFYVDTPVDICFQRKQKRDRTCEKSIEKNYLQQLNDEYKNMYTSSHFIGVQTIDGTRDVKTITNEILEKI